MNITFLLEDSPGLAESENSSRPRFPQMIRNQATDFEGFTGHDRVAQDADEPAREPWRKLVIEAGSEQQADVGEVGAQVRSDRRLDAGRLNVAPSRPEMRCEGAHAAFVLRGDNKHRLAQVDAGPRADQRYRAAQLFELPGQVARLAVAGVRQH